MITTQTITDRPTVAMVLWSTNAGISLRHFTMKTPEQARAEFGPTLADAEAFLLGVCCNECGEENETVGMIDRECRGCATRGCGCVLVEDSHVRDTFWCTDCNPRCGCYDCTGD